MGIGLLACTSTAFAQLTELNWQDLLATDYGRAMNAMQAVSNEIASRGYDSQAVFQAIFNVYRVGKHRSTAPAL
jgi:hypothetical protein